MATFKIALTAGHYLYTAGKRCLKSLDPKETREWVLNDRIADKVETLLKKNYTGYELLRTDDTTGKKSVGLDARTAAANKFGADFYLSVHHNAGVKGGKGGGIMAIAHPSASATSLEWQKDLYAALIKATGLKGNRTDPLAKQNLHELRTTNMPAVLLELGFMDSRTDVPIILTEEFADQCAEAIVEVIAKRGKLPKKVTGSSSSSGSTSTTTNTGRIDSVIEVQRWLNSAYSAGLEPDNAYGPKTKKAHVKALQKELGFTGDDIDGIFGKKTKAAVPTLGRGDEGPLVKILQGLMVCNGYNEAYVDGKYGAGTETAVEKYQDKTDGLEVDGEAGKETFEALCT